MWVLPPFRRAAYGMACQEGPYQGERAAIALPDPPAMLDVLLRKRPREPYDVPLDCLSRRNHSAGTVRDRPRALAGGAESAVVESTAATNGDGFGMGWYGEHAEPGLYREVRPAWSDENLRYLCRHIRSHLYFAHVRAATGTPITRPNCHPFACGRWLFMHNGMIGNWGRLRRRVEGLIPDAFYGSRIGTTDSEAVFLAILGGGEDDEEVGFRIGRAEARAEMVSTGGYR